ncbi:Chemotaxis response regulator protein-glutamate methylesterase of group 1 operon [Saliniradius amylolyticus]|uniref:Chemotaxis response regulator protein-glutamate methylesterase of group 1 operon n=1 Tax=Saliniradius amylolyticus TaxID=2183582 RepID=A0A2S2E5D3_9ALTE|nr:response regulator transcription factor [Saliniradius amylolyticus]AWL12864.1 Chemotaxis response regulator protein-glutamate methylesterase of group 1 operon [Saliniradius amylolyticus]
MSIRVMLVDDQMLIRQGIAGLLALSEQVSVVAQVDSGEAALATLKKTQVDVILMDIRMPKMDGIDTLTALRKSGDTTPVIMLTTFNDHELVMNAIKAGASGYLLKDVSLDTLVEGIERVHKGETLIQPVVSEQILQGLKGMRRDFESYERPEALSDKEVETLRLMAAGCSNKEIAEALFKSEGTVKNQVSSIMAKLGVRDRTRAVLKAIELGLI